MTNGGSGGIKTWGVNAKSEPDWQARISANLDWLVERLEQKQTGGTKAERLIFSAPFHAGQADPRRIHLFQR